MKRPLILPLLPPWLTLASALAVLLTLTLMLASPVQAQDDLTVSPGPETVSLVSEVSLDAVQEAEQEAEHEAGQEGHEAAIPPMWLLAPFIILLLMIATGPLFYGRHWHHHYPKYAVGLGVIVTVFYVFVLHDTTSMMHALKEFLSFIALVASLFIAASGIYLKINARGTPLANVVLLTVGAVIANLIVLPALLEVSGISPVPQLRSTTPTTPITPRS